MPWSDNLLGDLVNWLAVSTAEKVPVRFVGAVQL